MDFGGTTWHEVFVLAAVVLGPIGCLASLGYAFRVDHRDSWRRPMLTTALFGLLAILGAYVTGERTLTDNPDLAVDPQLRAHQDYAANLVLPTVGWFVVATVTGWINPRTGAFKLLMPMVLAGFATVVLVLVVLTGSPDARSLLRDLTGEF
jgi:hypothetical protein